MSDGLSAGDQLIAVVLRRDSAFHLPSHQLPSLSVRVDQNIVSWNPVISWLRRIED
jgi:hypothetical protein